MRPLESHDIWEHNWDDFFIFGLDLLIFTNVTLTLHRQIVNTELKIIIFL